MNNKKSLPIGKPFFATYHGEGAVGACLTANPSMRNWFLNNSVSIRCGTAFLGEYTSPDVHIYNGAFYDCPYIEKIHLPLDYLWNSLSKIVKNLIDDDYYVFVYNIDDYYVEGKSYYKTLHFTHDAFITGYDNEKHTYNLYSYDINWVYRSFTTPQRGLHLALKKCIEEKRKCEICAIKVKQDNIELDYSTMLTKIKAYLSSDFNRFPLGGKSGDIYGIVVHNYIAMYLDKLYDGSIPYEKMDRRVFKSFFDQKNFMLERIKLIENEFGLTEKLSKEYAKIVRAADMMRTIYAHYNKRHDNELLISIKSTLLDVKQKELELLSELTRQMEEHGIKEAH